MRQNVVVIPNKWLIAKNGWSWIKNNIADPKSGTYHVDAESNKAELMA